MESRTRIVNAFMAATGASSAGVVTATTTSNLVDVRGAKRIGFLFRRANNAGGSSTFAVKGGMEDGSDASTPTMTTLNMLIDNVTNSNAQTLTRVASKAISNANGDVLLWLSPECAVAWLSVTATIASDGDAKCLILLEY